MKNQTKKAPAFLAMLVVIGQTVFLSVVLAQQTEPTTTRKIDLG